jgi:hypothetical protein
LSADQLLQWERIWLRASSELEVLSATQAKEQSDLVEQIALLAEESGSIMTDEAVALYEKALRSRDTLVEMVADRYWAAAMQFRDLLAEDRHEELEQAALSAQRMVYFSAHRSPHPWTDEDPLTWLRNAVDSLDETAASEFREIIRSDVYRSASMSIADGAAREFRVATLRALGGARFFAELRERTSGLPATEATAVRREMGADRSRDVARVRRARWAFAQQVDQFMKSVFALFSEENAIALRWKWESRTWPEWLSNPTNDAVDAYSDVLELISRDSGIETDALRFARTLREEADAVAVASFDKMKRRWELDYTRRMLTGSMPLSATMAAREVHSRNRLRILRAEVAFCDHVEGLAREWLELQGDPGERSDLAEEVLARINALAEPEIGKGWVLRAMARDTQYLLDAGRPTWPPRPSLLY